MKRAAPAGDEEPRGNGGGRGRARAAKKKEGGLTAGHVMTRQVACCHPGETLEEAARLMWENDCGCVPVVDAHGIVLGMVTDRDACMACYTKGLPLSSIHVESIMTRKVHCCGIDEDVESVERRMQEHQIRRMPVVEGGELVGIVSLNDLALAARDARGKAALADTLAAISEHRGRALATQ